MGKARILRSIFVCIAVAMAAAPAVGATFRELADTSLVAPDGHTVFIFAPPQLAGSTVVFMGATGAPDVYIFSVPTAGGPPLSLISNKTKVPDGVGTFTGSDAGYFTAFQPPNCAPPVVGSTRAVFVGRDAAGNEGIYSVPLTGGEVVKLVNYGTPIPGGSVEGYSHFNVNYSFCNISISGNTVVFDAGGSGVYSVLTSGEKLTRIADGNTPATKPPFRVDGYAQPSISGSRITYIGSTVFGPYAVFVGAPTLADALVIATTKPEFAQFTYPIIAGTTIIYSAKLTPPNEGLFSLPATGGASTTIVDLNSKLPKGTPGKNFISVGPASDDDGWAPAGALSVFAAETTEGNNDYPGLFSACKGKLTKLLAQGDTLDGVVVGPGAGVSNLVAVTSGGKAAYRGAILVTSGRYAAIYTVTVPAC